MGCMFRLVGWWLFVAARLHMRCFSHLFSRQLTEQTQILIDVEVVFYTAESFKLGLPNCENQGFIYIDWAVFLLEKPYCSWFPYVDANAVVM